MSEFDKLQQALNESLASKDCNKARVLAAKLLVRAETASERETLHEAQQRVATCSISLSGVSATSKRKKHKKVARRAQQRSKARKLRQRMDDIKKLSLRDMIGIKEPIQLYKAKSDADALRHYTRTGNVPIGYRLGMTGLRRI